MRSMVFRGGVPIRPDVERIMKEHGELRHGDLVPHSMIENVIGVKRGSNRYQTVVASWRKRLFRELALQFSPEGDNGYRVMTPEQCNSAAVNDIGKVSRAAYRTAVRLDAIDTQRLSEQGKQTHQIARRHAYLLTDMARAAKREISLAAPPAVKALPRAAE